MADVRAERAAFNVQVAPRLAEVIGVSSQPPGARSSRFAYFEDESRFLVVAGAQEGADVDLAFALGLTYRGTKRLVLVLPAGLAFPTMQRAPWFRPEVQPEIWLHDGSTVDREPLPSRDSTFEALERRLEPGDDLHKELRRAATAVHLGVRSPSVYSLVEWATTHERLDAGHRRGERSWHCMGQRVLSIRPTRSGLALTAGIHYTDAARAPQIVELSTGEELDAGAIEAIKDAVVAGVGERFGGVAPIGRQDEHWLQAVIRRDPSLVGVEQPALREIPAWRPRGTGSATGAGWGRGFIDLLGIDGHGDIRIVETKLADNADDLLVLQGLDYYVWATAYRQVLLDRLGASRHASLEIHYVIGADDKDNVKVSRFVAAQARGLDDMVRWRFQTVRGWYPKPGGPDRPDVRLLTVGEVP